MKSVMRHDEIINGTLSFPTQIEELLKMDDMPLAQSDLIIRYWDALWHAFLNEDGVNGLWWAEVFKSSGMDKVWIHLNYYMEKLEWSQMDIGGAFCLISLRESKIRKWVSRQELYKVRKTYRLQHYMMRLSGPGHHDLVKIGNGQKKTGIIRNGFQHAGTCKFRYDIRAIRKYQKAITHEVSKKLVAGIKNVDYKSIVKELIARYANDNQMYNLGQNISDSRGRAIFDCTKRVFNPIANKTARACLELPAPVRLTSDGWQNVYAFIAELNHVKANTWEDKCNAGKHLAESNTLSGKCDLHEHIWLDRIYDNIDHYEQDGWNVPISADVTACGLAILGILTNDHHFLDGTNIIGNTLKDIWTVPGLPRDYTKKAITPILYGSSQSPSELWESHDFEYSREQVNIINNELLDGRFKNVLKFREYIIGNVVPHPKMHVKIWEEEFDIYCNRFKWGVTIPVKYQFLTGNNMAKTVIKETAMVYDTNAFKTYFATLLLHNLDSQIANYVCEHLDWVIPIHDDFITDPNSLTTVRNLYVNKLRDLYVNRHTVMEEYCQSIGIDKPFEDTDSQVLDPMTFSGHCLK